MGGAYRSLRASPSPSLSLPLSSVPYSTLLASLPSASPSLSLSSPDEDQPPLASLSMSEAAAAGGQGVGQGERRAVGEQALGEAPASVAAQPGKAAARPHPRRTSA